MKWRESSRLLRLLFMAFLLISILLSTIIFWTWCRTIRYSATAVQESSQDTQRILFHMVDAQDEVFRIIQTSATNLAKILDASVLERNWDSFDATRKQASPPLFSAYSMVPYLLHAQYIGNNGILLAYYKDLNQTKLLFSNSSCHEKICKLYGELVDERNMRSLGSTHDLSHLIATHSGWIKSALEHRHPQILAAPRLADGEELNFLFTAPVASVGAISLGVSQNDIIKHSTHGTDLGSFSIYLITRDGKVLAQRGPSIPYLSNGEQQLIPHSDELCKYDFDSYSNIEGRLYAVHCTPINTTGDPLVLAIVSIHKDLMRPIHEMGVLVLVVLGIMLVVLGLQNHVMYHFATRYQKIVCFLSAAVIDSKEAIQQAERKSMNKSLAFASASHDIRGSIAGFTALIDICRSLIPPDIELHNHLQQLDECASKLLGILNSVLDIAKVEEGKMELKEDEFNIAEVVEKSVDFFRIVALKRNLELVWDPCDFSVMRFFMVRGDCQRLKQVLDNLLGNAIKFTLEGRVILRVWAKNTGSHHNLKKPLEDVCQITNLWNPLTSCYGKPDVYYSESSYSGNIEPSFIEFTFEVDDSGIGIPKEKRASIFENYVQVGDLKSTKEAIGTGLGLGIVQSYVRLMGGEISIIDKDVNQKGTCFRFNIFLNQLLPTLSVDIDGPFQHCRSFDRLHGATIVQLIQGPETRRSSKSWMELCGANVLDVDKLEMLELSLKKIKNGLSASGHVTASLSEREANERSVPILIIIDILDQPMEKLISTLANFGKGIDENHYRVVWLQDFDSPPAYLSRLKRKDVPCHRIMQKPLHGSRIFEVSSLLKGDGSLDSARVLPCDGDHEASVCSHDIMTNKLPLDGWKILVVDDMSYLRNITSRIISKLGGEAQLAENGEVAVNIIKEKLQELADGGRNLGTMGRTSKGGFYYDIILMDCEMPQMDGYEAARRIRVEEEKYGIHIPIIAVSGHEGKEKEASCKEAGMDMLMTKPFSEVLLLNVIRALRIAKNL